MHANRVYFFGALTGLILMSAVPAQAQFQNGDLVVGRGFFDDTMAIVRGGSIVADPFTQGFIAAMDFDNTGGVNNNAAGNLLMIDRGPSSSNSQVYAASTDGSGTTTLIGNWDSLAFPGFNDVAGRADFLEQLAVSPDNTKVAMTTAGSSTDGSVLLFDYNPAMIGVDDTMVLTNGRSLDSAWWAFGNHDLEWMDNDTLLLVDGDAAFVDTVDLDGSGNFDVGSRTRHRELLGPNGGEQPLDSDSAPVAYNPDISPYVYVGSGDFADGNASNYIWVLDPNDTETNGDWKQVARARFDAGFNQGIRPSNTIRDMELMDNGDLAVTMFGGSVYTLDMSTLDGSVCPDPVNFNDPDGGCGGLLDNLNATMLIDGDIEFDTDEPTDGQSNSQFVYMTIARTAAAFDEADFDQDGDVDGDDFLLWQGGFGTTSGATKMDGDYDNDGDVDGDDFLGWQSEFGNGGGSGAVPEPTAIVMALLLGVAIAAKRFVRKR